MAGKLIFVDGTKVKRLNGVNYHLRKHLDSMCWYLKRYVMTTDKPSRDNIASQKLKDKLEEDNAIPKSHCLVMWMMIWFLCAKKFLSAIEIKYGGKSITYIQLLLEKFILSPWMRTSVVDHVNLISLVTKPMWFTWEFMLDKMQVSTRLNDLLHANQLLLS